MSQQGEKDIFTDVVPFFAGRHFLFTLEKYTHDKGKTKEETRRVGTSRFAL